MKKINQKWILSGWCPECCKSLEILNSTNIAQVMKYKKYYQIMLKDDRPVAKCKNCGAYHESFEVVPVIN